MKYLLDKDEDIDFAKNGILFIYVFVPVFYGIFISIFK